MQNCRPGASIDGIIQTLFTAPHAIKHHLAAPLYRQRAEYLKHLAEEGRCGQTLKDTAALLIHVIRVLRLDEINSVSDARIREAAELWSLEELSHRRPPLRKSALRFYTAANGFTSYHGMKTTSDPLTCCFDPIFFLFQDFLINKGYKPTTMRAIASPVRSFLLWLSKRQPSLPLLRPESIETYLLSGVSALGWRPRTVVSHCQAIRSFLHFLESRSSCKPGLYKAIVNPVVRSCDSAVTGPAWEVVRRMIERIGDESAYESRAKPILILCGVYGLRSSEITQLTLDAFDWKGESFVLQRAKNGYWQRFPLTSELGGAIHHYLRYHRPHSACRTLFLTLLPPHRPLQSLCSIIRKELTQTGIDPKGIGPHSLRHSGATELLRQGTSLRNIANFLGHRDLRSVSIYARHHLQSLQIVADFSLSRVI